MLSVVVAGFTHAADEAGHRRLAFVQAPLGTTRSASSPACAGIGRSMFADRYAAGVRIVMTDGDNPADIAGDMRIVSQDFVCAANPAFSPDGRRMLFSGKRLERDHLQIWEWTVDDPVPRLVVAHDADCVMPAYLGDNPDRRIVFASLLAKEYEEHGGRLSLSLYEADPGGGAAIRLTWNPSSDFDPVVLPDGRILYSSWQHVGNYLWPWGAVSLMLINADGTGLFPLTDPHAGPVVQRRGTPIGDDHLAFVEARGFGDAGAGALVQVSMNDPLAQPKELVSTRQFQVAGLARDGQDALVISARPVESSPNKRTTFGLCRRTKDGLELMYDDPEYDDLSPAVATPGAAPEPYVSTVVPGTPFGYLLILNCLETDRTDPEALRSRGVKYVRVIEADPLREDGPIGPAFLASPRQADEPLIRPNSATGYHPARILGEVPPAADGSVYMKVPADRPLRIQLIDQEGFSALNERAWFWVRPNERRACIGCHENRELSPDNAAPLAAKRVPTDLTDPTGWRTVSFRKDIQPILEASCALSGCHTPPSPAAGMNLSRNRLSDAADAELADRFGPAYANLLKRQEGKPFAVGGRRVHPGDARRSPLLWMLYGRALAPQYEPAPFDTPIVSGHPGPMLPEAKLELIRTWVDLGAPYDDQSPPGPWPYGTANTGNRSEGALDKK